MASIADSYYGLVIENFECEQSIYTAVEVTAGKEGDFDAMTGLFFPFPVFLAAFGVLGGLFLARA